MIAEIHSLQKNANLDTCVLSRTCQGPDSFVPAVVIRGVDGAVRQVGSGTELWQTLGVEQRPRAALVGGKLQAHT